MPVKQDFSVDHMCEKGRNRAKKYYDLNKDAINRKRREARALIKAAALAGREPVARDIEPINEPIMDNEVREPERVIRRGRPRKTVPVKPVPKPGDL